MIFWMSVMLILSESSFVNCDEQNKYHNSTLVDRKQQLKHFQDTKVLSELPLKQLLKVKNSIVDFSKYDQFLEVDESVKEKEDLMPEALALSSDPENPNRRTDLWSKKGKGGKISSLFSLSVTTLSFLAFGGYLLCLIVQAIKGKNGVSYGSTMAGVQPVMLMSGSIKKKKPQINYGRRRRDLGSEDEADKMYEALIRLAEGYAAWNGI